MQTVMYLIIAAVSFVTGYFARNVFDFIREINEIEKSLKTFTEEERK